MDPLLRFMKHKRVPRLSGARPGTLSLDPATFEKVDETFIRARSAQGAYYTTPWAIMAAATFRKPATLAPTIRSPGLPTSTDAS